VRGNFPPAEPAPRPSPIFGGEAWPRADHRRTLAVGLFPVTGRGTASSRFGGPVAGPSRRVFSSRALSRETNASENFRWSREGAAKPRVDLHVGGGGPPRGFTQAKRTSSPISFFDAPPAAPLLRSRGSSPSSSLPFNFRARIPFAPSPVEPDAG